MHDIRRDRRRDRRAAGMLIALALSVGIHTTPSDAIAAPPAEAPTKAAEEEARAHFAAGVNLLRDPARPRYDEAYIAFKKAYALVSSPKILGNLGLCAMKLERDAEAIDAFTRYLSDVPDLLADERAQVERDLATLKATLATVTFDSRPSGLTILDTRVPSHGEPVTNTYGPFSKRTELSLRKGHHIFKGRFEGGRELTWESDITGGESHVFELPAQPTATTTKSSASASRANRPVPVSVFVMGGVTAALGVGSVITGLVAIDKRSTFDERNDGFHPNAANDLRDTGTTLNIVSDVLLIGTIVAAGVTTYLYFTRPSVAGRDGRVGSHLGRTDLSVHF